MQSTQLLSRHHAAIAAVLERFEDVLDAAVQNGALDAESFEPLLAFLEERVDGQHQEEEERIFMPRLLTRAGGEEARHVQSVLDEHIAQRQLLIRMRGDLKGAARGTPEVLADLAELGRRYVRRQRLHAAWEDRILMPLAERVLTSQDDQAILNGLQRLDETWGGGLEEAALRLMASLERHTPVILA